MTNDPRWHIEADNGTLCGQRSMAARMRVVDCTRCNELMDVIIGVLIDTAEGNPTASDKAKKLVRKLNIKKIVPEDDDEPEPPNNRVPGGGWRTV